MTNKRALLIVFYCHIPSVHSYSNTRKNLCFGVCFWFAFYSYVLLVTILFTEDQRMDSGYSRVESRGTESSRLLL